MKILVLGDSLTFSHHVNIENTWPYLLQASGHAVTHRGRGGATIDKILYELNEIEDWSKETQEDNKRPFDICIIQVGIVDVTPRPFSRNITYLLKQVPIIKFLPLKLNKSKIFLKFFGKPWTTEDIFLKKFELLKKKINNFSKNTVFIEIARPSHNLIANCGDFSNMVKKYNQILKKSNDQHKFLKVYDDKPSGEFLLEDGYHLNKNGHNLIYQNILKII
jgi:hypothetical protein